MDALVAASLEDLTSVPTIGPRTAQSFYEYLHDEQNAALIAKLREAGVNMVGERVAAREGPLTGLALVVSGSLTRWSRNEVEGLIKRLGGAVGSSVTQEDQLPGRRREPGLQADQGHGVQACAVLDEDAFVALLTEKGAPIEYTSAVGPNGRRGPLRYL